MKQPGDPWGVSFHTKYYQFHCTPPKHSFPSSMSTQAASAPAPSTQPASAPAPPKKKKSNAKLKRLSGEALAAYNARIQNCGVCYIARVPPYMKPSARARTKI